MEKIADFFNVTTGSFFIRERKPIDYETETDMENGYLKKLIQYQETTINAAHLLDDANNYMLEQLKHRVAELESRLKYIQAHPEAIAELPPLPEFNLIVPYAQGVGEPTVYTRHSMFAHVSRSGDSSSASLEVPFKALLHIRTA